VTEVIVADFIIQDHVHSYCRKPGSVPVAFCNELSACMLRSINCCLVMAMQRQVVCGDFNSVPAMKDRCSTTVVLARYNQPQLVSLPTHEASSFRNRWMNSFVTSQYDHCYLATTRYSLLSTRFAIISSVCRRLIYVSRQRRHQKNRAAELMFRHDILKSRLYDMHRCNGLVFHTEA